MIEELENIEKLENKDSVETVESVESVNSVDATESESESVNSVDATESESVEILKKDSNKKWYVLRVMGGKEKKTVAFIEKEIDRLKMQDHVSKILVPTEKVYQIRNGKKISKERNFFPGYVLVEANLVGEVPHVLKNITNVLGFLGATKGGVPVPMRQSEINKILGRVDEMAITDEHVNIPFIVGESVKVIDGPFNSFHAEIEAIDEQKKKLKLMVKIFGRKTPLELNFMQVEKI
jgi:transcriptional antiterminator NusG